jgi:hypothetical protein
MDAETLKLVQRAIEDLGDAIMAAKHPGYRGVSADELAQFKTAGGKVGLPGAVPAWVYLSKQLDSISSWLRGELLRRANVPKFPDGRPMFVYGTPNFDAGSEPLSTRFADIRNLLIFLAACITDDFGDFLGVLEETGDQGEPPKDTNVLVDTPAKANEVAAHVIEVGRDYETYPELPVTRYMNRPMGWRQVTASDPAIRGDCNHVGRVCVDKHPITGRLMATCSNCGAQWDEPPEHIVKITYERKCGWCGEDTEADISVCRACGREDSLGE